MDIVEIFKICKPPPPPPPKSNLVNFDLFWTDLIQNVTTFYINIFLLRNQIWSSLIHFGQIWSKKIKNKTAIFILSVNVTNFYRNIFRLVRKSNLIKFDQVWSVLDRSDPKKSKKNQPFYPFCKCDNFL